MALEITDSYEEIWLKYPDTDEEYLVRYGLDAYLELLAKHKEDAMALMEEFFDFILRAWKNINYKKKPASCDAKTKWAFCLAQTKRRQWIIEKAMTPATFGIKSFAEIAKNLSQPSTGS